MTHSEDAELHGRRLGLLFSGIHEVLATHAEPITGRRKFWHLINLHVLHVATR